MITHILPNGKSNSSTWPPASEISNPSLRNEKHVEQDSGIKAWYRRLKKPHSPDTARQTGQSDSPGTVDAGRSNPQRDAPIRQGEFEQDQFTTSRSPQLQSTNSNESFYQLGDDVGTLSELQYQAANSPKQKITNEYLIQERSQLKALVRQVKEESVKQADALNAELDRCKGLALQEKWDLEDRLDKAVEDGKDRVQQLINSHEQAVQWWQQKSLEQEECIANVRDEGRTKANELQHEHESIASGLQERIERMKSDHGSELRTQSEWYEEREKTLVESHGQQMHLQEYEAKTQRDNLVLQHQRATQQLNRQVAELNAALVTRDDEVYCSEGIRTPRLPQKSDGKLRESFVELEELVDYLGRLPWSPNSQLWPEHDLQRMGGQQGLRGLKKAIVQDLVWCLLYQYVFASPFRLFGAQGIAIEREWLKSCGQGEHSLSMLAVRLA